MSKKRRKWTKKEEEILKENYPFMGYKVCKLFPTRTKSSVLRKADWMDLKVKRKTRRTQRKDRIGYLDIETSQLAADFGICYSWVIKEQGKNHYDSAVITREEILNGTLDKRVIQKCIDVMKTYTLIYTYYGTKFDVKFIRTRALIHNLDFIPRGEVEHRDLYYLAKRVFRLHRYRLETVCDALGIVGKTHIDQKLWILANTGNPEALKYIYKHNLADVDILEAAHEKMADFETRTRRWL